MPSAVLACQASQCAACTHQNIGSSNGSSTLGSLDVDNSFDLARGLSRVHRPRRSHPASSSDSTWRRQHCQAPRFFGGGPSPPGARSTRSRCFWTAECPCLLLLRRRPPYLRPAPSTASVAKLLLARNRPLFAVQQKETMQGRQRSTCFHGGATRKRLGFSFHCSWFPVKDFALHGISSQVVRRADVADDAVPSVQFCTVGESVKPATFSGLSHMHIQVSYSTCRCM